MIEGITILNTYEHSLPLYTAFMIAFIVGFVVFVIVAIDTDDAVPGLIMGGMMLVLSFFIIAIPTGFGKKTTRYEVTISSSVSFQELNEHYNIIDQQGMIYTLEEKVNNK